MQHTIKVVTLGQELLCWGLYTGVGYSPSLFSCQYTLMVPDCDLVRTIARFAMLDGRWALWLFPLHYRIFD